MRFFAALSFFVTLSAHAETPKIVCVGVDGQTFESTLRNLNIDGMYDGQCEEKLFSGRVCYRGIKAQVIRILQGLSDGDLLGDEFRLRNIRATNTGIEYTIWDGPNSTALDTVTIQKCRQEE